MALIKFRHGLGASLLVLGGIGFVTWPSLPAADPASTAAVDSARRETKMLDTLYKTAIVSVTDFYVEDETSTAAATSFKPVFKAMKDNQYHEVRLVDGLGEAINPDNSPRDDFEKEAMKAMLAGEASFERVETVDGKSQLRTMTTLPMVMQKCVLCHENYRDKKIIGGVAYVVPIR
jgi:hypothetical protein